MLISLSVITSNECFYSSVIVILYGDLVYLTVMCGGGGVVCLMGSAELRW